jgi:hypothetical protein
MSLARFGVLMCVIASCGCFVGQSAAESNRTQQVDDCNPRHVTGIVIDDLTGKPIIGAKVQLSIMVVHSSCLGCALSPRPPERPSAPRSMMTGEGGSFTFDDVPPRMINVAASKSGYLPAWPIRRRANDTLGTFETVHGSVNSIVILLAPEATVTGVLRHHDGTPVTLQPQIAMMHVRSWAGFPRVEAAGWPIQGVGSPACIVFCT